MKTVADALERYDKNYVKPAVESIEGKAPLASPNFTGTPTAPTADNDTDDTQLATTEFCQNLIRRLVGAAPETLNTLVELAVAINNDPNFAQTIVQALDGKLNKTDAQSTYLSKTDANTTYAKKTDVPSTDNFLPKNNPSVIGDIQLYQGSAYRGEIGVSRHSIDLYQYEEDGSRGAHLALDYQDLVLANTAGSIALTTNNNGSIVKFYVDELWVRNTKIYPA